MEAGQTMNLLFSKNGYETATKIIGYNDGTVLVSLTPILTTPTPSLTSTAIPTPSPTTTPTPGDQGGYWLAGSVMAVLAGCLIIIRYRK